MAASRVTLIDWHVLRTQLAIFCFMHSHIWFDATFSAIDFGKLAFVLDSVQVLHASYP